LDTSNTQFDREPAAFVGTVKGVAAQSVLDVISSAGCEDASAWEAVGRGPVPGAEFEAVNMNDFQTICTTAARSISGCAYWLSGRAGRTVSR
jgi:hypothetical protein